MNNFKKSKTVKLLVNQSTVQGTREKIIVNVCEDCEREFKGKQRDIKCFECREWNTHSS